MAGHDRPCPAHRTCRLLERVRLDGNLKNEGREGSVCPDVRGANDVMPLLRVFDDEPVERRGRTAKSREARVGKSLLHLGICHCSADLVPELSDDVFAGLLWCAEAIPGAC